MKKVIIFAVALTLVLTGCKFSKENANTYKTDYEIKKEKLDSVKQLVDNDTLKTQVLIRDFEPDTIYYEESYTKYPFAFGGEIIKNNHNIRFHVLCCTLWKQGNPLKEVKIQVNGNKYTWDCGYYYSNDLQYIGACNEYYGFQEKELVEVVNADSIDALFVFEKGDIPVMGIKGKELASLKHMYNEFIVMRGFFNIE